MVTRKTTAVAFIAILITELLMVFVTQVEAETTDDQKQALIGEWSGVWGWGAMRTPATLIIHEIDTANAKARCTYISAQLGEKKVPVLADFIPGPNPKIEFKEWEGNEFKFVLKNKVLHGTFCGMTPSGIYTRTAIEMKKEPKK